MIDANSIAQLHELLAKVLTFAPLTDAEIDAAANMRWKDFEDALQEATAEHIGADYIITRNTKDFAASSVPSLTPADFLQLIEA